MEETNFSDIYEGEIVGIRFGLASHREICTASVSGSSISHATQLSNPFLGLPLEFGKCESCGTSDLGNCEGHFGYIELPVPIYHPSHVSELKRMLSLLCLKCLKMKKNKFPVKNAGIAEQLLASCCQDASQVSIEEVKKDTYSHLRLKVPSNKKLHEGFWNFLERYGFRYGGSPGEELLRRTLLPCEVMEIFKKIPEETRKKLVGKGYFPQDGYILQYLPVPPNCLSVPEISDGITIMSTDPSTSMLKKVLRQGEIIKSSRSQPNFESLEVEANELQSIVNQYLQVRGSVKASRDIDARFGVNKEEKNSSRKVWLEKMRTLFIRKGSGFSSRSVITGDAYKAVNEVGIPYEIARWITFEEKVSSHNMKYLQELVDNKLCLTYKDGSSTYSLREGSKGHTFLKLGQVVHRRIMDGDIVFINRPPTTHKHSLQALRVYVHEDNTVKINPLICGPLSADFDGDCVHLFYPQSPAAKAEVLELFSLEKQILSSHSGGMILQLACDSLLSLKIMFKTYFMDKIAAQQLVMFASSSLPQPAFWLTHSGDPFWTALQVLQTALPTSLDCYGDRFLIKGSDILVLDFNRDVSVINDIGASICSEKGSEEVLKFFNALQPLLMENIFAQGFSVGLEDFSISQEVIKNITKDIQLISPLLYHLRSTYNELVELQLENQIRFAKAPVTNFILKSSSMGNLIDPKSDSAINKVVQQIGFLGLQISDRGKFYSKTLVEDVSCLYTRKYPENVDYPSAEHGLIRSCFFHGLDPYEEIVHSISTREVIVRSSRGLTEPGTLFKNLMAILRDVVICYDGTVRNVCSNSIIQFEYGRGSARNLYPAGEPVGVLAATAMSNPAYKAVLDSSPSSNSSWELMKEILLCKAIFRNELIDRRVILYLNHCGCGRKYCREQATYLVQNQLKKVSLKDTAVEFMIEYKNQSSFSAVDMNAGLVGHIHLNEVLLKEMDIGMNEILQKCEEAINSVRKKKLGKHLKKAVLSVSECCTFHKSGLDGTSEFPCLLISIRENMNDTLEESSKILADSICPFLLETIIKGDSRISSAKITWLSSDTTSIRSPQNSDMGELAVDVVLDKSAIKRSGDAWRIVIDSCLPVLHLIDTRRSIPYGIKQIQELLGISCAFDQAVQRLSTSVSMVSKGVLKEHLILLANSMTYAGNLIGFNSGGYKALTRSLNVQVPFTEATLITPKRCFERAAEKCHVDSLTSIVASCSWGKHVAVGTGSRFDILWDTRKVEFNQAGGVDVNNFLHMVSTAYGEEASTACLGEEIDDLMPGDDIAELCLSPENFNSDRPVFEDIDEFQDISEKDLPGKSSWDNLSSFRSGSSSGKEWGSNNNVGTKYDVGSSWGTANKEEQEVIPSKGEPDNSWSNGWENKNSGRMELETMKSDWRGDADERHNPFSSKPQESSKRSDVWDATPGWGTNTASEKVSSSTGWNSENISSGAGWSKADSDNSHAKGWNSENISSGAGWSKAGSDNSHAKGWKSENISSGAGWSKADSDNSHAKGWNSENISSGAGWSKAGSDNSSHAKGWNSENISSGAGWSKADSDNSHAKGWNSENISSGAGWSKAGSDNSHAKGWNSENISSGAGWSKAGSDNSSHAKGWNSENISSGAGWSKEDSDNSHAKGWNSENISSGAGWSKAGSDNSHAKGWNSENISSGARWSKADSDNTHAKSTDWNTTSDRTKTMTKNTWSGWHGEKSEKEDILSTKSQQDLPRNSDWGAVSNRENNAERAYEFVSKDQPLPDQVSEPCDWDNKLTPQKAVSGWLSSNDEGWTKDANSSERKEPTDSPVVYNSWEKRTSSEISQNVESASFNSWLPRAGDGGEVEKPNEWVKKSGSFKKNHGETSGGWGSDSGDWKIKKNHPGKFPRMNNDNTSVRLFTETRQRLDLFTSEEQDALSLIEPTMKSIRRIMHKSGYNDGDPIRPEDQSFIIDNVFNYHPDKAAKMGSGIDHLMISRHSSFQDSRCLYVVSTDGRKEDFSYRKCLGNLIKSRFPDVADEFLDKYFRKPKPGGNQDRISTPEPAWNNTQAPTPEPSGNTMAPTPEPSEIEKM
ncbi:DNA-directed RNA polymerase E subunit 1 [Morus notabilis]|uniref:DNA-directed RNA polymerase subunit n=2 Tax=Morus notabilis TaxID=981085 RepID=W9RNW0_9ROSA|nr:DNA-directed RNA polymerase E subunit 1 [Morus notabilis]